MECGRVRSLVWDAIVIGCIKGWREEKPDIMRRGGGVCCCEQKKKIEKIDRVVGLLTIEFKVLQTKS